MPTAGNSRRDAASSRRRNVGCGRTPGVRNEAKSYLPRRSAKRGLVSGGGTPRGP